MAEQSWVAKLQAMRFAEEDGGGGGPTPISSTINVQIDTSITTGPGDMKIEGLSKILEMSSGEELKDLVNAMNSSTVLKALFGNINTGPLLPTIDYLAGLRPKPQSIFSKKLTDRLLGVIGPTVAH
jgi:hypothetical protein